MLCDKNKTILVVDDEVFYLDVMRDILEYEGYTVLTATGGHEAFDIVAENKIDLIITDIRMPKGDGVEFLLAVRKNNKEFPPIIMMSGFSLQEMSSLKDKGADLVLKKPVDTEVLLSEILKFDTVS